MKIQFVWHLILLSLQSCTPELTFRPQQTHPDSCKMWSTNSRTAKLDIWPRLLVPLIKPTLVNECGKIFVRFYFETKKRNRIKQVLLFSNQTQCALASSAFKFDESNRVKNSVSLFGSFECDYFFSCTFLTLQVERAAPRNGAIGLPEIFTW